MAVLTVHSTTYAVVCINCMHSATMHANINQMVEFYFLWAHSLVLFVIFCAWQQYVTEQKLKTFLWAMMNIIQWRCGICDFWCHETSVKTYLLLNNQQQQPLKGRLSGTTRVGLYQKKHSPTHTHPGQRTSFITFLHLQRSMASSLFSLRAWQSSRTTSFQVLNPQLHAPYISSPSHHMTVPAQPVLLQYQCYVIYP